MPKQIISLLTLLTILMLFGACKKDKTPENDDPALSEVAEILRELDAEFFNIGALTGGQSGGGFDGPAGLGVATTRCGAGGG